MAVVEGAGALTRSRIEAFNQTAAVLSDSATQWRGQAKRLEQAADFYVNQVRAPNGTEWSGQTAVSYFDTAYADRLAVLPAVTHAHAMADVAERGGDRLLAARRAALAAIAEAEADDFSVGEDLSVTDKYVWQSPAEQATRQAAAVGHRNYIAHHAALLHAENQRVAAQLNNGAAQMAGMAPAHWRQPVTGFAQPVPAIHAVDSRTWKQDPQLPMPVDPKDMTEAEARAAWEAVNADMARYSARCGRTFVLPNEQAAYDACLADRGPLLDRQAAIRARLRDLGIPIEGEQPPTPAEGTPPFPPPTKITGFTGHGEEQVSGRDGHGVNDRALQDAIANPTQTPIFELDEEGRGAYKYLGKDAAVVLNKDGQVVTAWPRNRNGWRHP
jgi:hypothetical protein